MKLSLDDLDHKILQLLETDGRAPAKFIAEKFKMFQLSTGAILRNEIKNKTKLGEEISDKDIPGFGEVFRNISLKTVGTSAIQSRACAVLANGKYVFALPGSSGGVTDAWDGILKHQLDANHKPCNFVELFPRLKEK